MEGAHTGTITHSASGGGYDGVSISSVVANVTDNDTGSVTVTESAASTDVTESGLTDSYTLVLDLEPSGNVTVSISADAEVSLSTTTLTFTPSNWDTAQEVVVTAVNDAVVEGTHTSTSTHSAIGSGYDGVSISDVVTSITDNDTGSVTITEAGGTNVTEGGSVDTYDVALDLEPSGNVTITITPDAQVSVNTTTLTFTPLNFSSPQTVTVTAVDDAVVEGTHTGSITHSAAGGNYDGISISSVVATTTDDDNPGVTITESGGSTDVTELTPPTATSTDVYDVVLDLQPSGAVTITITTDNEVDVSPTVLTFTTSSWSAPQTVTVTAVDDVVVEALLPETSTITHVASSGAYDGVSIADVAASVTDNDVPPSVIVTESGGSTDVTEGGATDTYKVVLDTQPTGNVTITISPGAQASVNTTTLTFTIANFSTTQTVTVTAVNDAIVEAGLTDTITSVASGGSYDGVGVPDVVVNVTDNDPGVVNITETSSSTDVTETSGNDTYDVVLGTEPDSTVTVNITPDSQVTANTGSLTFTTSTWDTPQTVTVTAVNEVSSKSV